MQKFENTTPPSSSCDNKSIYGLLIQFHSQNLDHGDKSRGKQDEKERAQKNSTIIHLYIYKRTTTYT
jgi:hypothetical protein